MPEPPIDFADVIARADLRALIEADIGPPSRSRKWLCPFHDDHDPSLALDRQGRRWRRWRCWSCGAKGDALDWVARRNNCTVVEAVRYLDPVRYGVAAPKRRPPPPRPEPAAPRVAPRPAWTGGEWQSAFDGLVVEAERALWSSGGREALAWLRGRGLEEWTITRFRLGFLAGDGRTAPVEFPGGECRPLAYVRGILIPWAAPGGWYAIGGDAPDGPRWCGGNIRRLMPDVRDPWDRSRGGCCLTAGTWGSTTSPGAIWPPGWRLRSHDSAIEPALFPC